MVGCRLCSYSYITRWVKLIQSWNKKNMWCKYSNHQFFEEKLQKLRGLDGAERAFRKALYLEREATLFLLLLSIEWRKILCNIYKRSPTAVCSPSLALSWANLSLWFRTCSLTTTDNNWLALNTNLTSIWPVKVDVRANSWQFITGSCPDPNLCTFPMDHVDIPNFPRTTNHLWISAPIFNFHHPNSAATTGAFYASAPWSWIM